MPEAISELPLQFGCFVIDTGGHGFHAIRRRRSEAINLRSLRTISLCYVVSRDSRGQAVRTKYKLVDLFCGCGGISRGFERTGRFGTQLGVELAPHPAAAFSKNIRDIEDAPAHTVVDDITAITSDNSRLWSELRRSGINAVGEIDVLAGGPPCQGFSRNGVRKYTGNDRSERFFDDPRNHLYKSFLTFVEQSMPKVLLIENVREFLNFGEGKFSRDLVTKLNEIGYDVEYKKLCAADFGVPQTRWRVFFLGVRKDIADAIGKGPAFPEAKFGSKSAQLPLLENAAAHRTVRDAIADLPKPASLKGLDGIRYERDKGISELGLSLRNPEGYVYNHFARPLSKKQVDQDQRSWLW